MVTVIFRSRLKQEALSGPLKLEYEEWANRMIEMAKKHPGFRSIKTFAADDGERVSISEFDSEESAQAWKQVPEHLEAQKRGREAFYSEYRVQICEVLRDYSV